MEIEFYEEKDLTETYKQLKKMIATVLGENEFETITNTEAKVVANGMWKSCYKVSWVSIDYLDVKHFLVGENGDETMCEKAIFASIGYGKTLKEAYKNALKRPFINDFQPQCKEDFSTLQFPHRIMMLIAVNNTENEPTSGELDEVFSYLHKSQNDTYILWNYLLDESMTEAIRVCLVVVKNTEMVMANRNLKNS